MRRYLDHCRPDSVSLDRVHMHGVTQSNAVGWLSQSVTDTIKCWQEQSLEFVNSRSRCVLLGRGSHETMGGMGALGEHGEGGGTGANIDGIDIVMDQQ